MIYFWWQVPIVLPIIVLIASAYLVVAPIIEEPTLEFLYAFLFILSGLIFYLPFVFYKKELGCMSKLKIQHVYILKLCTAWHSEIKLYHSPERKAYRGVARRYEINLSKRLRNMMKKKQYNKTLHFARNPNRAPCVQNYMRVLTRALASLLRTTFHFSLWKSITWSSYFEYSIATWNLLDQKYYIMKASHL